MLPAAMHCAPWCVQAKNPVRTDILEMLGAEKLGLTCGAVCVYPSLVKSAVKALEVRPPQRVQWPGLVVVGALLGCVHASPAAIVWQPR